MSPPDLFELPHEPDDRFASGAPLPLPRRPIAGASEREPPNGASPCRLRTSPQLLLSEAVYHEILRRLTWPPETAGLLLGPKHSDHVVTHFVFDEGARGTPGSITIDHAGLNEQLRQYTKAGQDCKGYVHAHPPGCDGLSYGDFSAVRALFGKDSNRGLARFFMPLVCGGRLLPFVVCREDLDAGHDVSRVAQLVLF